MILRNKPWMPWALLMGVALVLLFFGWRARSGAEIIVEWSTASEINTAGFNLYRRASGDETFRRINETLIPGAADPLLGGEYKFVDDQVTPGILYDYQLEEVETTGRTTRLETVQAQAEPGGRLATTLAAGLLLLAGIGLVVRGRVWGTQTGS